MRTYTPLTRSPISTSRWWPATLLLLLTAAGLVGYVYFHPNADFTTQVWYRNAWVQIGSIGVTALLLIVGVLALRGDSLRPPATGVFLSLLLHASLLFWARQYYLHSRRKRRRKQN